MTDADAIRRREDRIRLFRVLVCLLAVWCIMFPWILLMWWRLDFDFLWRIVSLGPNKVGVDSPRPAFTIEFIPSVETARVLGGCFVELIIWIFVFIVSFLENKSLCYYSAAIGVVMGFFSVPFYFFNTNFPYPLFYVTKLFDETDLNFYIAKSSTLFWLGFAPKILILSLFVVTAYKLARPTRKPAPSSPLDWGAGRVLALTLIGAPLAVAVLLLAYGAMVSGYDNYYAPRTAELAERAAKAARERAELPRRIAALHEKNCARIDELVKSLVTTRADFRKYILAEWKGRCAGYYVDPQSWKRAKTFSDLRAIKMSHEQLCADKNILDYTLKPPPQISQDKVIPQKNKVDVEVYQWAQEAVQALYLSAWNEACSK
jgi:hypothetical protein